MFFWDYETSGLRDIAGDARAFCSLVFSSSRGLVARYPVVHSHSQVFSGILRYSQLTARCPAVKLVVKRYPETSTYIKAANKIFDSTSAKAEYKY